VQLSSILLSSFAVVYQFVSCFSLEMKALVGDGGRGELSRREREELVKTEFCPND
jgi:hypothetical protein